jgi:hypothetical protein
MIGLRYYLLRTSKQDSRSYVYFNVSTRPIILSFCGLVDFQTVSIQAWLFMAHLLPSQARWDILAF